MKMRKIKLILLLLSLFVYESSAQEVFSSTFTNITASSVSFSAFVTPDGIATAVTFEYGTTSGNYSATTSTTALVASSLTFNAGVTGSGLTPNTTYFSIVRAASSTLNFVSTESSFSTIPDVATVTAGSQSNLTSSSIDISFTTYNGNDNSNAAIRYGTSSGVYTFIQNYASNPIVASMSSTTHSQGLTGLAPETRYFYITENTNSQNTAQTGESSFRTRSTEPAAHSTAFSGQGLTLNSLEITFDAANTIAGCDGYLILHRIGSYSSGVPVDGNAYANGSTLGDGTVVIVNDVNALRTELSGLTPNMQYYFQIIPFNWDGVNNDTYNYRTQATVPSTIVSLEVPSIAAHLISNLTYNSASFSADIGDGRLSTTVTFEYGNSTGNYSSTTTPIVLAGNSTTVNTGLTQSGYNPNTTYYTRVRALNSNDNTLSSESSFTTIVANATATLGAESNITINSANISFSAYNGNGASNAAVRYGTSSGVYTFTQNYASNPIAASLTSGNFSQGLSALNPQTNYFYRIQNVNSQNTGNSAESNFWTLANEPAAHSATFHGTDQTLTSAELFFDAANTITDCDGYVIVYSLNNYSTGTLNDGGAYLVNNAVGSGFVGAVVTSSVQTSATVTHLLTGNEYFFLLFPYNWNGANDETYNYRNQATVSRTTVSLGIPIISASSVSVIDSAKVDVEYTIDEDGGDVVTSSGLVWGAQYPTLDDVSEEISEGGLGSFSGSVIGEITPSVSLYARVYATNSYGTAYGESFEIRLYDRDGRSVAEEDAAPNSGDGNNDGIPDSKQRDVVSFVSNSAGAYISIESIDGFELSEISEANPEERSIYAFPLGVVKFSVDASVAQIKIYYHSTSDLSGYVYRKKDKNENWFNFQDAVFSSEIIDGNQVATVTLTLHDGDIEDYGPPRDGIIIDPGGPVFIASATNIPIWDSPWAILAFLMFPILVLRFKKS